MIVSRDVLDFRETDKTSDNLGLDPGGLFQQVKHAWGARLCLKEGDERGRVEQESFSLKRAVETADFADSTDSQGLL